MAAYYNELDPYAAQWLRNLIAAGHIAAGEVDERSIEDVRPDDLRGFTQCHFFAGIGVWSFALRLADWPDDRPVWTGSCPCQPFSQAGKGVGFADERHLWPTWDWLISECRPSVIVGEQVASKDIDPWIDLVQADLEAMGYAVGCVPFPSAGVGAPHIRDRAYFMAYADNARSQGRRRVQERAAECIARTRGVVGVVADTDSEQHNWRWDVWSGRRPEHSIGCPVGGLGEPDNGRREGTGLSTEWCDGGYQSSAERNGEAGEQSTIAAHRRSRIDFASAGPGPTNGFWRAADWLLCRDGKWRPVEPGYEQMADGSAGSLGRVCAADIEEITEEVNAWSLRHQTDAGEALRRVWTDLQSQALSEREAGRFSGVQSPAVLLAFLRQLTEQRWGFADALACSRTEASRFALRIMHLDAGSARAPLRRELEEQLSGQPADAVQELSSIVASHAASCWGEACRKKAGAASFPLANGAESRVGRLRAYGNAINAQAAAEFIRAAREAIEQ